MQTSAHLRSRLADQAQVLRAPLALADRVRNAGAWLAAHPQWLLAAAGVLALLRPRRALAWSLKLWWGWRAWQQVQRFISSRSQPDTGVQPAWNPFAR